jgi:hypothetical protein
VSQRRPPRGVPTTPGGNAGVRGALLLGVAVILGIVLLQQFDNNLDTGGTVSATSIPGSQTTTTRRVGLTTVAPITTTTLKTRPKTEYKVLVANGAGVQGIAAATTNALKNVGYTTITPASANATVDKTSIQYAEGYEAEARELAATLNQPATAVARLSSPPVAAADLGDAKVVVVLGVDVSTTTTAAAAATTSTTRRN